MTSSANTNTNTNTSATTLQKENWKYTPLRKLETTKTYTPQSPAVTLPTGTIDGLTLSPLSWEDFIASIPDQHKSSPICAGIDTPTASAWQITLADNATPETLLTLATLSATQGTNTTLGIHLTLGHHSQLTLLQETASTRNTLARTLMLITLKDGARLHHARAQNAAREGDTTQLALTHATLARDASYHLTTVTTGATLSRQEDHIHLLATGAEVTTNSLSLLAESRHGDTTTRIHHLAEQTTSSQEARAVLTGHATGIYQGQIFVAPQAQKTNGYQMSRALLLSPTATMNAKPELEIYADDVKCGHGTAIGALDETALYYLRARGIPHTIARRLLIEGFTGEITAPLPEPLRTPLATITQEWLEELP